MSVVLLINSLNQFASKNPPGEIISGLGPIPSYISSTMLLKVVVSVAYWAAVTLAPTPLPHNSFPTKFISIVLVKCS
ncbi:hypothetical protein HanRHA438_Chr06g0274031 [Helianthus annuus]|nr:hypothetical protein HanRHA438_Chr06g0274031 [Helianthus annuus]